jgi:ATP-binding cassette subfamily B protein/ATP-binding cassette subfamily C protein/ATP-binding cassette subfamily B multidrug efflux pump
VPRAVGRIVDGLVDGTLGGTALARELGIVVAIGAMIYLLRVGWRLQLFAAAFRLGVELRTRFYQRLAEQGPPFFARSRTGDLMARATNDVDAIEMVAGEAFLAGFDGTLTLVLVIVAYLPMVKPKYGDKNCVKFNAGRLKLSPDGEGNN